MNLDRKWLVDFNFGKTQIILLDLGAIYVKVDKFALKEKSYLRITGVAFVF